MQTPCAHGAASRGGTSPAPPARLGEARGLGTQLWVLADKCSPGRGVSCLDRWLGVPRWRMPAKGRYFLNEGEEGPDQDALYEKYRLTSQHGPLLLMLLLVAIAACTTLIIITFSYGVSGGSPWVLGASLGSRSQL